jgi:hypothetical protein
MITLQSDTLQFAFPQIDRQLQRMLAQHIEVTIPRLIAEDREAAVSGLSEIWEYRNGSATDRAEAERLILTASRFQIVEAFRRKCEDWARDVEEIASVRVNFERTLRIPDDGKTYPLPAGVGKFPLCHLDDFEKSVPESWLKRGGVMMPMHQSEAMWIRFSTSYPFAMKVGAGKINAVSGEAWSAELQREPQNYLVLPEQPWLDGFAVGKGIIRQFVAMPLGDGYSVEEQLTGKAETGGIQLQVFPMKAEAYFRKEIATSIPTTLKDILEELLGDWMPVVCNMAGFPCLDAMGLGAGGQIRQEIYQDPNDFEDWDTGNTRRCFIHLCNSLVWRQITGSNPPHPPLTSREYAESGIPWFDYYRDDRSALNGSKALAAVKSVATVSQEKGKTLTSNHETIEPQTIIQYGNTRRPDEVREWNES